MDVISIKEKLRQAKEDLLQAETACAEIRKEIKKYEEAISLHESCLETGAKFKVAVDGMVAGGMPEALATEVVMKALNLR